MFFVIAFDFTEAGSCMSSYGVGFISQHSIPELKRTRTSTALC